MSGIPEVGSKAPAFDLPAYPEGRFKLSGLKGKYVVLYFYPKDDTPGCTTEACDFRDRYETITAANTIVLGISRDPVEAHQKFTTKYELPFPLLSDPDHAIAEKYGVWVEKTMYGKTSMGLQRSTFLIDPAGKIAFVWPRVKVPGHAEKVVAKIQELTAAS